MDQNVISNADVEELSGLRPRSPLVAQRLKKIHNAYSQGYQAANSTDDLEAIIPKLNTIEAELHGFAFEGVGTALALKDVLTPSDENRVAAFVLGPGAAFDTYVYVGMGLMLGKKKQQLEPHFKSLNFARRWLVLDGYGFQHGFSHWKEYLGGQPAPEHLSGYNCRVFDQGLGRSIWFADGTDATRISQTISAFPKMRQADLWGGVGYACAYAGGADRATLEALKIAAGNYKPILAQAVILAANSRQLLGIPSAYTKLACEILCEIDTINVSKVSKIIDRMLKKPANSSVIPNSSWIHYRMHLIGIDRVAMPA